jgi:hypothetical protein
MSKPTKRNNADRPDPLGVPRPLGAKGPWPPRTLHLGVMTILDPPEPIKPRKAPRSSRGG